MHHSLDHLSSNRPNGRNREPLSSHPTGHDPERIVAGRQLWDQMMEAIDRLPPGRPAFYSPPCIYTGNWILRRPEGRRN